MAARTFNFNLDGFGDEMSKWLKALQGSDGPRNVKSGDHRAFVVKPSTPSAKYVFSKGSNGVFHGTQYIGQGTLTGSTLFVNQYKPVTCQNFALSHITNQN